MNSNQSRILNSLPHIRHHFGSLNSLKEERLPNWKQVHGISVVEVLEIHQDCGECDAIYTQRPHLPIGVRSADCVPILIAHQTRAIVAAIHSGWRGTLAHISNHTWQVLKRVDSRPHQWAVAIGPAIRRCCYQVSEEIISYFEKEFPFASHQEWKADDRKIDLPFLVQAEWQKIGVQSIDLLDACTFCTYQKAPNGGPVYNSFRRDQGKGRQTSTIEIVVS